MDRNDEIRKRAEELSRQIKNTEKELNSLRNLCNHSEYTIKDVNFDSGSSKLRRVCKFCNKTLGFPSDEDLKNHGYH
jgi:hypothetical protein